MTTIDRQPEKAARSDYDAIIVGGGIYGIALSLEASCRGLRTILLERDDFGGATTYNHLRIVHGGIRYLQKMDLHRFFESIAERRWYLRQFPHLVEPLTCMMPLYGRGLQRPPILKAALWLNDLLSTRRNADVAPHRHLPNGAMISAAKAAEHFPLVDRKGLQGAAIWYDAAVTDSQLLMTEMLKRACQQGATAVNYCEVQSLVTRNGRVQGVNAKDHAGGNYLQFSAPRVINAAGPWCRQLAARMDKDHPRLFHSSLAWNVLLERPALSPFALAVTPKRDGAQTYFVRPWKGRILAGTIHSAYNGIGPRPQPTESDLDAFIADLNTTIPSACLSRSDVRHVYAGLLPAKTAFSDQIAVREVILDHALNGGPKGLVSVSGVKFTTARLVAEKTIRAIFGKDNMSSCRASLDRPENASTSRPRGSFDFDWQPSAENHSWQEPLQRIISEEAVVHLDDLVLRRTNLGDNPQRAIAIAPKLCRLFDWSPERQEQEIRRLQDFFSYL